MWPTTVWGTTLIAVGAAIAGVLLVWVVYKIWQVLKKKPRAASSDGTTPAQTAEKDEPETTTWQDLVSGATPVTVSPPDTQVATSKGDAALAEPETATWQDLVAGAAPVAISPADTQGHTDRSDVALRNVAVAISDLAAQQEELLDKMEELTIDADLIFNIYGMRQLSSRVSFQAEAALATEGILLDSGTDPIPASTLARLAMQSNMTVENIQLTVLQDPVIVPSVTRPVRLLLAEILEALALANRFGRSLLTVDMSDGRPVFEAHTRGAHVEEAYFVQLDKAAHAHSFEMRDDPACRAIATASVIASQIGAELRLSRTAGGNCEYRLILASDQVASINRVDTAAPLLNSTAAEEPTSWRQMVTSVESKPVVTPPLYREVAARMALEGLMAGVEDDFKDESDYLEPIPGHSDEETSLYFDLQSFTRGRYEPDRSDLGRTSVPWGSAGSLGDERG
ncbi:hypothetical protein U6G28_00960 [Actinomycetaceae bacterium MB13-C1-2]|nr:hypothetical protein U6G28_00960 [Actinomycetaceae bacterium MB13-C1-2]